MDGLDDLEGDAVPVNSVEKAEAFPNTIGASSTESSSTSPEFRYCEMTSAPPEIRTSLPPAASDEPRNPQVPQSAVWRQGGCSCRVRQDY